MEFTSRIENFNTPLWTYHIKVPIEAADAFLVKGSRRVICRLDRRVSFQCAILPAGEEVFFILINKKLRDKLKLHEGSNVHVHLKKDDSEYGLPMPPEFKEVLATDKEGDELFHALSPGKQRSLLHIIGTPKSSDARIKRSLAIVEHLKKTEGKVLFRQLGEEMKNF